MRQRVRAIDAWLQKRFDAAVHEVMRRTGASKRTMRRLGWVGAVGSIFLRGRCGAPTTADWFTMTIFGLHLVTDDWCDWRAEQARGCVSVADSHGNEIGRKVGGAFLVVLSVFIFWPFVRWPVGSKVFDTLFAFSFLFQGYLCGTSPQAPAKKKREARALFGRMVQS